MSAYYYIYDSYLNDKKYRAVLAKIENRLTDLGINGHIGRLSLLKNIEELIGDELKRGVATVVAVGNDKTVNQVVNVIASKPGVALGIIPIGERNQIAELLGIPQAELACETLSARKTEKLDVGKIHSVKNASGAADKQFYFLSGAVIPSQGVKLKFDEGYNIVPMDQNGYISIYNFYCPMSGKRKSFCHNPQNELLEISVENQPAEGFLKRFKNTQEILPSIFPAKKVTVVGKKTAPIIVDCEIVAKTPAVFRIAPQKLKVIVGRERVF